METENLCFEEGWNAYEEQGECPYPPLSLERQKWLEGYDAAIESLCDDDPED